MSFEQAMRRSFVKKAALIAGSALIVSPLVFIEYS